MRRYTKAALVVLIAIVVATSCQLISPNPPDDTTPPAPVVNSAVSQIVISRDAHPLERLAASELQRCLYQMNPKFLPIKNEFTPAIPSLVIASANTVHSISKNLGESSCQAPANGFRVTQIRRPGAKHLLILGESPRETLQGVYSFLEKQGAGFFIDGEFVPKAEPDFSGQTAGSSPLFSVRAMMPLASGAVSRRDWRMQDYLDYIDAIAAMRCNTLFLDFAKDEPFANLLKKNNSTQGKFVAKKTDAAYAFGMSKFFTASDASLEESFASASGDKAMARCRAALRTVLARAAERGVRVCINMEVDSDATHEKGMRLMLDRLDHLLQTCPTLDYVCIRPKAIDGNKKIAFKNISRQMLHYTNLYGKHFPKIMQSEMILQAVPVLRFAAAARQRLAALTPHTKLVVDALNEGLAEGFDALLDPSVIIVSRKSLPQSNRAWWRIIDGEEQAVPGLPASGVKSMIAACRNAYENSASGVIFAHSRTAAVCRSADAFAHCCWSVGAAEADFCADFARRRFGAVLGTQVCPTLSQLDKLLCGHWKRKKEASWRCFDGATIRGELKAVRAKLLVARNAAIVSGDFRPIANLDNILHSIEWALSIDGVSRVLTSELPKALAKKDAVAAKLLLKRGSPGWGVAHCAAKVSCRDELMELREILRTFIAEYREGLSGVDAILGEDAFGIVEADFVAQKVFPFYSISIQNLEIPQSVEGGREFFARVFIPHIGPLSVAEMLYRRAGERMFARVPLESAGGHEYRAKLKLPATSGLIEYRINAVTSRGNSMALPLGPDGAVAVMGVVPPKGYGVFVLSGDVAAAQHKPYRLGVAITSSGAPPIETTLLYRVAGAQKFASVRMEGDGLGNFSVEIPARVMGREGVEYYLEITDPSGARSRQPFADNIALRPDFSPPSKVANIVVTNLSGCGVLKWSPTTDDRGVDYYEIYRRPVAPAEGRVWVKMGRAYINEFIDADVQSGIKYEYKVVAVDFAGNASEAGE